MKIQNKQFCYKLLPYVLVNPVIKISLINKTKRFPGVARVNKLINKLIYKIAKLFLSFGYPLSVFNKTLYSPGARPLGGACHPQSRARGGNTYDWRATEPTLFVFVLTATFPLFC